jgi:hypothetical protein
LPWAGRVVQVVECLSSKCEFLSSNPSTIKKKKKKGRRKEKKYLALQVPCFFFLSTRSLLSTLYESDIILDSEAQKGAKFKISK